jgi:HSP20 family protein
VKIAVYRARFPLQFRQSPPAASLRQSSRPWPIGVRVRRFIEAAVPDAADETYRKQLLSIASADMLDDLDVAIRISEGGDGMATFGGFFFSGARNGNPADGEIFSSIPDGPPDVWQPAADIVETEEGFLVQMDLPGVEATSVEAMIEGSRLLVRGIRRAVCPGRGKRYIHMEISRGEFGKTIVLPAPVSGEGASALLRNGVLEISLPRERRQIPASAILRVMVNI